MRDRFTESHPASATRATDKEAAEHAARQLRIYRERESSATVGLRARVSLIVFEKITAGLRVLWPTLADESCFWVTTPIALHLTAYPNLERFVGLYPKPCFDWCQQAHKFFDCTPTAARELVGAEEASPLESACVSALTTRAPAGCLLASSRETAGQLWKGDLTGVAGGETT